MTCLCLRCRTWSCRWAGRGWVEVPGSPSPEDALPPGAAPADRPLRTGEGGVSEAAISTTVVTWRPGAGWVNIDNIIIILLCIYCLIFIANIVLIHRAYLTRCWTGWTRTYFTESLCLPFSFDEQWTRPRPYDEIWHIVPVWPDS